MNKYKLFLMTMAFGLFSASLFASGISGRSGPDANDFTPEDTGEFLLHVPKFCGIDVTKATGEIFLAADAGPNNSAVEFLLLSNAAGNCTVEFTFSGFEDINDASGVPIEPSSIIARVEGDKLDETWDLSTPTYTISPKKNENGNVVYSVYLYFDNGVELTQIEAGDYTVDVTIKANCDI